MAETNETDKKIEDLIAQLRLDVGDDCPLNTRTLSIENTRTPGTESKDIDEQISDLEDLIKRLQAELAEMSKTDQKIDNESLSSKDDSVSNKEDIEEAAPEISCLIIQDGSMLHDAKEKFTGEVTKLMSYQGTSETIPESLSDIRTNFSALWFDTNPKDDHLDELISELKAEISEKLETLKDIDLGPTLNNSMENIP